MIKNNFKRLSKNFKIFIKLSLTTFSSNDDAFWEEYKKRKAEPGGRFKALPTQDIIYNDTPHTWKFASNHSLTVNEFLTCLKELEPKQEEPFVIVDVREESEFDLYKFPLRTKVKV